MSSLFERLGGEPAIDAAVDIFYIKVLGDNDINHFFANLDMEKQHKAQKAFLTYAFGGPNKYTGRGLGAAHSKLHLTDHHYDRVMHHLGATLQELNVPSDLITEAAAIAESVRGAVLGRT